MAETIKGINIVIGAETTGLSKALSDVNKKSKDIQSELRQVERLLKLDPKNTELLAQKQKLLSDAVANTREKLDSLKAAQEQVNQQFAKGEISEGQYRAFQREIAKTEQDLKKFETQLKSMEPTIESFGDKLQKAGDKIGDAGKKLTDAGKNLSMKVTAPLVGLGVAAAKTGMDFEAAMSEVGAISGAAGEDLAKLEALAKEMGATTKFSASEAAEGLKYMAMAGWDTQQMLEGLPGVLSLAAASGEDLGRVSDIVTDALTAFGMQASEAGEFADILAAASSNANTNVGMLGESFKYVAPVFGSLGYSAEDAALALGLMANAGIKASQAGTALRGAITRMMKPSKDAAKLIDELGLKFTDAEGNMLPFRDVMDQLRSAFANLTAEQQAQYAATIFGQEAMSGMLAIINASEGDYNKLAAAVDSSAGAAQKMADIMQDNLKGRLTELKSALEGVALQLYDHLQPALENLIEIVRKVVDWFANLSPEAQKVIVIIAGLAAAIGPLLVVLGVLASSIGSIIAIAPTLGAAFTALTGPIGVAIAAVAALIAIGVDLYKNWDEIKANAQKIWNSIKSFFSATVNSIKNTVSIKFREMVQAVRDRMEETRQQIREVWDNIINFLKGINLFSIGRDIMQGLLDGINNMARAIYDKARDIANSVKDTIKSALRISSPSKVMLEMGLDVGKGFELGLEQAIGSIKAAATGLAGAAVPDTRQTAAAHATTQQVVQPISFASMFAGANFYVRNDIDIQLIARELFNLQQQAARRRGL